MGSSSIYTALKAMKDADTNKGSIIKDKKVNKPLKTDNKPVKSGGKKRGRPKKEDGTKKEKINVLLEPKYILILKKEADDKGLPLSNYIASEYIIEQLKKKYEDK